MNVLSLESLPNIYSFMEENNVKIYNESLNIYDIVNQHLEKNKGDESFVIVDLGDIIRQYNKWEELLPRIKPYYAIKCNPSPIIIELLNKLGCNFDTASRNEILKVINLGVDPKNIIFANPCKPVDFIKFSRSNDIDLLVVDSEYELHKIKLYHPEAKILIRIKTDDSKSKCKFNIKFGLELEQVKPLLILSNILAINIVGVSFHVGSGCQDANVYNKALSDTKEVFKIAEDLNIKMDIIDIGGGFPGTNDNNITFEDIVSVINKSIDELFYDKLDRIKFIAEPGRYFVASSHTLVCSIINKKEYIENDEKKYIYYISDGLYGTFSGLMFDYAKVELLPFNERNEKRYNSIVFGPTCDSLDIVSKDCQLPSLAIGESIIIKNIGAYSIASGTEFNGFPKPDEYFILT
jgi:ornithine decarboxylase